MHLKASTLLPDLANHVTGVEPDKYITYRPICFYVLVKGRVDRSDFDNWITRKFYRDCKEATIVHETLYDVECTHAYIEMSAYSLASTGKAITTVSGFKYYMGKINSPGRKKTVIEIFNAAVATGTDTVTVALNTDQQMLADMKSEVARLNEVNNKLLVQELSQLKEETNAWIKSSFGVDVKVKDELTKYCKQTITRKNNSSFTDDEAMSILKCNITVLKTLRAQVSEDILNRFCDMIHSKDLKIQKQDKLHREVIALLQPANDTLRNDNT